MKTNGLKIAIASALLLMTASAPALQPEVLYSFQPGSGSASKGRLVQGSDGNFYGTRLSNPFSHGMVFRVTTNGVFTSLASYTNGWNLSELVLGPDDNFYGTDEGDGSISGGGDGTVFRVTTNGVLTTWASFTGTNGTSPFGGLVLGPGGNLYGTTVGGGSIRFFGGDGGYGTVFKVTTNGVLTSLVSFTGTNGTSPFGGLVFGRDGYFYGTTGGGGSVDRGTVFRVTTNGVLTTLVSFNGANGWGPSGRLILGHDGSFYGTTSLGGPSGYGTVFKVTTNGVLTTLVSFIDSIPGWSSAGLLLGRDGSFYGTTTGDGSSSFGRVFRVTTNGVLTTLVSFTGLNGTNPQAGLVLGSDGYFYGTTAYGGPGGGGTIFRLVISAFTSVARQPGGSVFLTGNGPRNGGYRLWASADLSLPFATRTLLTSASFDSNGNFSYTDAGAVTSSSRFYQLSVP